MTLKPNWTADWLALIFLALFLSGCSANTGQQAAPQATSSPVTGAVIETAVSSTLEAAAGQPAIEEVAPEEGGDGLPEAATAAPCQDTLVFIKDITIPDGTVVAPESTLDKRWEVKNSGNCNWDGSYRVRLIAGPELGSQKEQALYPARSGTQAVIRILFKAPAEAGTYRSAWQAFNSQGEPFGDPFFVEIIVQAP
jgi:hypothetical protein